MQVYGAAWNGDDLCHDPLSLPLSLLFVPCDPLNTILKVAKLLQAILGAVVDLKAYYVNNITSLSTCTRRNYVVQRK